MIKSIPPETSHGRFEIHATEVEGELFEFEQKNSPLGAFKITHNIYPQREIYVMEHEKYSLLLRNTYI